MLAALCASAQVNIQFHYDLGRSIYPQSESDRQNVTVRFEQFRSDQLGNIYYFVNFDFYSAGMKGTYLEFSREFNLRKSLAAHIEYNGGVTTGHDSEYGSQYQHALLVGPAYNLHSPDYRRTLSFRALYKQYFKGHFNKAYPGFQLTTAWTMNFGERDIFSFSGYVDFWRNRNAFTGKYNYIVITEPQFWINFDSIKGVHKTGISIGTKQELSNNLIVPCSGSRTLFWNPSVALKWTMN
ncbi:MAG: DUF5020 family protein [Prevotellaceae bacterium]|nr:DUF5020 family protein [Prevotellaceae bacterium]